MEDRLTESQAQGHAALWATTLEERAVSDFA